MTMYRPNVGDVLLKKYEILSLVGEGAFGCVYRACDSKLNRDVAIKFINSSDRILTRFMDELEAIKKLDHPNIVRLYDYDILKGGVPCIVMEYVNGRELGDVLTSVGAFSCAEICDIALQVLDGLVETHKQGIVHCDLKPENIMLVDVGARKNVVKLIDFGVASLLNKASENERSRMLVGTPQYMAPEQILHKPLGPWTDIYALGLILIELFTGHFVFDHEDPREVLRMQLYSPVVLPHKLACTEIGPIISRAVEKDVANRYQSTQELYDEFKEASSMMRTVARHRPRVDSVRTRAMPSLFNDIDDFLSSSAQKMERKASSSRPNIPRSVHSREFSVEDLNLGALQSSLDVMSVASLAKEDAPRLVQHSADVPLLAPASVPELEPAVEPSDLDSNEKLKRIERASVLASASNKRVTSIDSNLDAVTKVSGRRRANGQRKVSHRNRNLAMLAIFVLLLIGVFGYAYSSGLLEAWGLFAKPALEVVEETPAPPSVSRDFVKYSIIRETATKMSYLAFMSGFIGGEIRSGDIKTYRVIGTPTDAEIHLNGDLVCKSTPCSVHLFGLPEGNVLDIRKNGHDVPFTMPSNQSSDNPIILVWHP